VYTLDDHLDVFIPLADRRRFRNRGRPTLAQPGERLFISRLSLESPRVHALLRARTPRDARLFLGIILYYTLSGARRRSHYRVRPSHVIISYGRGAFSHCRVSSLAHPSVPVTRRFSI